VLFIPPPPPPHITHSVPTRDGFAYVTPPPFDPPGSLSYCVRYALTALKDVLTTRTVKCCKPHTALVVIAFEGRKTELHIPRLRMFALKYSAPPQIFAPTCVIPASRDLAHERIRGEVPDLGCLKLIYAPISVSQVRLKIFADTTCGDPKLYNRCQKQ
jgi:hypothetical protein